MKDIKKFAKSLIVPILIGIASGIFAARVIGPAFNLDLFAIGVTAVISTAILISLRFSKLERKNNLQN